MSPAYQLYPVVSDFSITACSDPGAAALDYSGAWSLTIFGMVQFFPLTSPLDFIQMAASSCWRKTHSLHYFKSLYRQFFVKFHTPAESVFVVRIFVCFKYAWVSHTIVPVFDRETPTTSVAGLDKIPSSLGSPGSPSSSCSCLLHSILQRRVRKQESFGAFVDP